MEVELLSVSYSCHYCFLGNVTFCVFFVFNICGYLYIIETICFKTKLWQMWGTWEGIESAKLWQIQEYAEIKSLIFSPKDETIVAVWTKVH
jgi:hypothetical protein